MRAPKPRVSWAKMKSLLVAWVVLVGMLLPVQAGINAEFKRHAGHPVFAAVLNFCVGLFALALIVVLTRVSFPSPSRVAGAPWWSWLGGLMGATLVVTAIVAVPRLGASLLVAGLVAGQLFSSLLIDHFGWVGYAVRPITWSRGLGAILLMIGTLLIERGR